MKKLFKHLVDFMDLKAAQRRDRQEMDFMQLKLNSQERIIAALSDLNKDERLKAEAMLHAQTIHMMVKQREEMNNEFLKLLKKA